MQQKDQEAFARLLADVHAFYRKELSPAVIRIWSVAMRPYDLAAVSDAFNRHAVNPDNGKWLPMPADLVKLIEGGTQDSALVAWAMVDRAVRTIGAWQTVVFDDPLIHAVLSDMGGWVELCKHEEREWPFRAKEFEARYRGLKIRAGRIPHPRSLPGLAEMGNASNGRPTDPPVLIGDPARARLVYEGGTDQPALITTIGAKLAELEFRPSLPQGSQP